jgi:murE/murF fusion protein
LSKIIKPDVSVITNINYAHAKNFKNLESIALAKSEIIQNTKPKGYIVLNADDRFFKMHKIIALKKNLKVISFGIKSKKSNIRFRNIHKSGKNFLINIDYNNQKKSFLVSNNFQSNIYNILGAIAVMSIYLNILELNKNIFLNFKTPEGRGDISRIKIMNKNINLIDESYNSNPLSLQSAILNFEKINTKKSKKYLLIGDMLELGRHSKKLHKSIAPIINKTKIYKVFVKGKNAKLIFQNLLNSKKGRILHNRSQIIELIKKDLNDNDYLMIKASNATGFNKIVKDLKGFE